MNALIKRLVEKKMGNTARAVCGYGQSSKAISINRMACVWKVGPCYTEAGSKK